MTKFVYAFGGGYSEGDATMKDLLGGKGANLAEMCNLGLPVPAGFTVTTECCTAYFANDGKFPPGLGDQVLAALAKTEETMGMKYGDPTNPLLVSCRSGARKSMPGMMDTVLNVGLASSTIPGMIEKTQNPRFVWDSYRRLIMMYADVVMEKAEGREPAKGVGIRRLLDVALDEYKHLRGYESDTQLTADDLKTLAEAFKRRVQQELGVPFPDDPMQQLWGGIGAVFKSWNGRKATAYRRIEGIPDDWGTACNVQAMVFGNMGDTSATGVAFTRNPATGENTFYGEWLINAQGEDVVAGIRTPNPLNDETKNAQNEHMPSMETLMPKAYRQLVEIREALEKNYQDMLDIEFTIQDKKLYMLQCRVGKRTGTAALNIAMDMLDEGMIDEQEAVMRLEPAQLDELLHPILDPKVEKTLEPFVKGLPAGPGAACGAIVFTAEEAVASFLAKQPCILVREETNPEDIEGMRAAVGILTARGGMTSHAALVARGWGKCCIVGAGDLQIDAAARTISANGLVFKGGDFITLNGTTGHAYAGRQDMIDASENPRFQRYMSLVDKFRTMGVRTNADSPDDARQARSFGAEGIGLFRTEHMFYGKNSDEPLKLLRKMILSGSPTERKAVLEELFPYMKRDIKATLEVMEGLPVTIRLLDPPLHEFIPHSEGHREELARELGVDVKEIEKRSDALLESNPMMGHRGVRLGVTYPEITATQVKAVFEASAEMVKAGKAVCPEIMVPVTCDARELAYTKRIIQDVYAEVSGRFGLTFDYHVGTMIEIPRAALLADKMAAEAEFFSFGTNDLTQMTFGFSRDDTGAFMQGYLEERIIDADPFQTIDQDGVGMLIEIAAKKGREARPGLKIGICGEQGGDPASVEFCFRQGLSYVSCSPFRVPIARVAAAHAAIKASRAKK
ncbi:MAG: pyruvate, phosphate dikinase [Kiritimatiellia bacterium]|jgi:pyruvate,orthophosphate dikinase